MMGTWFEYLVSADIKQEARDSYYDCASWMLIQDALDDANFTVIFNTMSLETNHTEITVFEMECGAEEAVGPVCQYPKEEKAKLLQEPQDLTTRTLQVVYTDYFSILIAAFCDHKDRQDFLVLSRYKQPSKFHRKKVKEILEANGAELDLLHKGLVFTCWDEDTYMAGF
eukprot:CAMPEP_0202956470 /NCGR_PEP_ID=MMETSP1396-20130829/978_1 /ASSEMBLY_ACC=CAM_ASM_000872 /TAXON_ID= /ORGANISM="Pseudokeronopsis sp., Strain Brazil" /LENGTH=168 /DNA_ID=CAMNT_0049673497 /DNA_START=134 /DNA_END=640 /DNA_ORIENTATION=-